MFGQGMRFQVIYTFGSVRAEVARMGPLVGMTHDVVLQVRWPLEGFSTMRTDVFPRDSEPVVPRDLFGFFWHRYL